MLKSTVNKKATKSLQSKSKQPTLTSKRQFITKTALKRNSIKTKLTSLPSNNNSTTHHNNTLLSLSSQTSLSPYNYTTLTSFSSFSTQSNNQSNSNAINNTNNNADDDDDDDDGEDEPIDPRKFVENRQVYIDMAKVRPQAVGERLAMIGAIWWRGYQDKKRWAKWEPKEPMFSALYANEIFMLVGQALENPISEYSYRLHNVAQQAQDLELPITHQYHLYLLAQNDVFIDAFKFVNYHGVSFPWTPEQIHKNIRFLNPPGIADEYILFQNRVQQLLNGKEMQNKNNKKKNTIINQHILPTTYTLDTNKDTISTNNTNQQQQQQDEVEEESDDDTNTIPEEKIATNLPQDIAALRHSFKLHQVTALSHGLTFDPVKFSAVTLPLDQVRRIAARLYSLVNSPTVRARIHEVMKQEVDPLGSFDIEEIRVWQDDTFAALFRAIDPFILKMLGDEFKLKNEMGFICAMAGIEQYLYDSEVQQHYHQYQLTLQRYMEPPRDSLLVREEMMKEQQRRLEEKRKIQLEEEKNKIDNDDIDDDESDSDSDDNSDDENKNKKVNNKNNIKQQGSQSQSTTDDKAINSTPPPSKAQKWKSTQLFTEQQYQQFQQQAEKEEEMDDDTIQHQNLRLLHGDDVDIATTTTTTTTQTSTTTTTEPSETTTTTTSTPTSQPTTQQSTPSPQSQQSSQQPSQQAPLTTPAGQQPQSQKPKAAAAFIHPQQRRGVGGQKM